MLCMLYCAGSISQMLGYFALDLSDISVRHDLHDVLDVGTISDRVSYGSAHNLNNRN